MGPRMGYVEKTLIAGEIISYRTRLHWISMLGHLTLGIVLGLVGLALLGGFVVVGPEGRGRALLTIASALLLVAAAVTLAIGIVRRNATEIVVTNRRLLIKTGILRRATTELLLSKVESVGVDEPLLGRMLGYGTVIVRGTGGTPEEFARVTNPIEFRRQIQGHLG